MAASGRPFIRRTAAFSIFDYFLSLRGFLLSGASTRPFRDKISIKIPQILQTLLYIVIDLLLAFLRKALFVPFFDKGHELFA